MTPLLGQVLVTAVRVVSKEGRTEGRKEGRKEGSKDVRRTLSTAFEGSDPRHACVTFQCRAGMASNTLFESCPFVALEPPRISSPLLASPLRARASRTHTHTHARTHTHTHTHARTRTHARAHTRAHVSRLQCACPQPHCDTCVTPLLL